MSGETIWGYLQGYLELRRPRPAPFWTYVYHGRRRTCSCTTARTDRRLAAPTNFIVHVRPPRGAAVAPGSRTRAPRCRRRGARAARWRGLERRTRGSDVRWTMHDHAIRFPSTYYKAEYAVIRISRSASPAPAPRGKSIIWKNWQNAQPRGNPQLPSTTAHIRNHCGRVTNSQAASRCTTCPRPRIALPYRPAFA